jgi:hypothetical protein
MGTQRYSRTAWQRFFGDLTQCDRLPTETQDQLRCLVVLRPNRPTGKHSFLIGVAEPELRLDESVVTPALHGLFLSPKSGHVVGKGPTNFILEGLRGDMGETMSFRDGRGCLGLEDTYNVI